MRNEESNIQIACVTWFRYQYTKYLCFAVPNGGARNAVTGKILKEEGVLVGVSDLIIIGEGKALFVEIKTAIGKQSDSQKEFQRRIELSGFPYIVCRSLDEFMIQINNYFKH
jgi:hypothetical protein